jgi:hypothetical protein
MPGLFTPTSLLPVIAGGQATPGATSKYLVKPMFALPGGLIVPVGAAAHAALALRRNASVTRRRALSFFGWRV